MKSFIEEYGFAILGAIVVILLIALCTPIGTLIRNEVSSIVGSMAGRTESKLSQVDGNLLLSQDGSNFKLRMKSNSTTNKYKVKFRFKGKNGWENWVSYGNLVNPYDVTYSNLPFEVVNKLDIQARVLDTGRNNKEASVSNIITYKGDKLEVGEAPASIEPEEGYTKYIYDANGGVFPNGKAVLYTKYSNTTNEIEDSNLPSEINPYDDDEILDYVARAERPGFINAGVEYLDPYEEGPNPTLFTVKVKWATEDEYALDSIEIYDAAGGHFPDGSGELVIEKYCLGTKMRVLKSKSSVPLTSGRVGSCYYKLNGEKIGEIPSPTKEGKELFDWFYEPAQYDETRDVYIYRQSAIWSDPIPGLTIYDTFKFSDDDSHYFYMGNDGNDIYYSLELEGGESQCYDMKMNKEEFLNVGFVLIRHNSTRPKCAPAAE